MESGKPRVTNIQTTQPNQVKSSSPRAIVPKTSFEATLAGRTKLPKGTKAPNAADAILEAIHQAANPEEALVQEEAKKQLGLALARGLNQNPKQSGIQLDKPDEPEDDE